ncbi:hypothetical protein [Acanthopleuribacter pedis]|uniref:HTTM domain-containing protein n=1 Tax=Acanthopleuribacter pedis TaxID=442870 RepID=A0A8J7U4Z3_9BACT|nr:hypothetical protein [Acanthopleuribacter pedis]MBO1320294.1 hypothetical protein [Acanthopleuribacter pedis]
MDATTALQWTTWLGALSTIQVALGWLSQAKLFREPGLLAWSVLRLRAAKRRRPRLTEAVTPLVGYHGVLVQLALRVILAGFTMWPSLPAAASALACTALFCLTLLWKWRQDPFAVNGNDQMHMLLWGSLALVHLGTWWFPDEKVSHLCLWFLTAMVLLSYATGGLAKVVDANWRGGKVFGQLHEVGVLRDLAATRGLCQAPWCHVAAWTVIAFELVAPLVLFLPPNVVVAVLCGLLLFHVVNAWLLAIQDFTLAWLTFFPAVYYTANSF